MATVQEFPPNRRTSAPRNKSSIKASSKTTSERKGNLVKILDESEWHRWDEFVASCDNASLFHSAWWYQAWGMAPQVHVLLDKKQSIEGGLCFAVGRKLGTQSIVRPPFTPRNGPVIGPTAKQGRYSENTHRKKVTLSLLGALQTLGMYDFSLCPTDLDSMPFIWNGFDTQVNYTYVIPKQEHDTCSSHSSQELRRKLRLAEQDFEKKNVWIDENPEIGEVLDLLSETAKSKSYKVAFNSERLEQWWDEVKSRNAGCLYVLRDASGTGLGTSIVVYDKSRAYYVAGGIRRDMRKNQHLNVLLLSRMMSEAARLGLDFDFEGSSLPGVERFIRSFGGRLEPLHRVVKVPSSLAALIWFGHRYLTRHRKQGWVWHD